MDWRWRRGRVAAIVVAAVTGAMALVWWALGDTTAATFAGVAGAVLIVAVPLLMWAFGLDAQSAAGDHGAQDLQPLTQRLVRRISAQWEQEAQDRGLLAPQPITVTWHRTDASMVDHLPLEASVAELVKCFRSHPRRRFVVIGEPGSGKTGILVLLAVHLLRGWEAGMPIPLFVTLSSWDPLREPFLQWLPRHMANEYPVVGSPGTAWDLLLSGRMLPLLDGLDELPANALVQAIRSINRIAAEQGLIMSCRRLEYQCAVREGTVIEGSEVVELDPVAAEDTVQFLRETSRLVRWDPVFAEVRNNAQGPLATALSSPLMVSLVREIYSTDRRKDPRELTDRLRFRTREDVEGHLLDALVPSLLVSNNERHDNNTTRRRWRVDDAHRWLRFLARHPGKRSAEGLRWWEFVPDLAVSIALSIPIGGVGAIAVIHGVGTHSAPGVALGFVVGAGLAIGWTWGSATTATPARIVQRLDQTTFLNLWQRLQRELARVATLSDTLVGFGIAGLVVVAGLTFLSVGMGEDPGAAAWFWIRIVLAICLVVALLAGLVVLILAILFGLTVDTGEVGSPASSLRADTAACVIRIGCVALISVIVGGLLSQVLSGRVSGLIDWLVLGAMCGLAISANRPWPHYQLTLASLVIQGQLPWRLMAFLVDAHRLGILRQVGAAYEFRHALLRDRLARTGGTNDERPVSTSVPVDPPKPVT